MRAATAQTLGDVDLVITKFNIDGTISLDDYNNFDYTGLSDALAVSSLSSNIYYNWTLTDLGRSNISKTGDSGFGILTTWDISNTSPTWQPSKETRLTYRSADYVVSPPYLEITYTTPDTTPPDSITDLTNTTVSCNSLFFNWTNPTDTDFDGIQVWQNNAALTNLSNVTTGVFWSGLTEDADITFSSKTFDLSGNANATFVNQTAHTGTCGVAPVAAFSADDTTVCTVTTVTFTDASTNTPTNWSWDFGDGNTSILQNPTHIFNITGSYTVNLTANNTYGADTESKVNYIVVSACPIPAPSAYTCTFTNMTGVTILPNSTNISMHSGRTSWGMTILNATEGNVSYYQCGSVVNPGSTGGGEAIGAIFGIIGGMLGGIIILRRGVT